ncbi:zinc ribbon domain-containing protein [Micromonospora sp. NPDC048930]|uniref:zinc ribbon domain-containing protein n=1 Tax=Micromonospora sp. NPDC048930 TaxID=3364261 RepID=UPI0037166C85
MNRNAVNLPTAPQHACHLRHFHEVAGVNRRLTASRSIDKNSRKSQAEFVCFFCGFTCNADTNAAVNVAAGQGGNVLSLANSPCRRATAATSRSNAGVWGLGTSLIPEPQPV